MFAAPVPVPIANGFITASEFTAGEWTIETLEQLCVRITRNSDGRTFYVANATYSVVYPEPVPEPVAAPVEPVVLKVSGRKK